MTLPTLNELPTNRRSSQRNPDKMLALALISTDDAELRKAAIRLFRTDERGDRAEDINASIKLRSELDEVPAVTPGGLAWKLKQILTYFTSGDARWEWAHLLLYSAVNDAIDLERQRLAGKEIRHDGPPTRSP